MQLAKIWKWLWSMQLLKTVICFRWLLIHYALLVGDWLRQHQQYACGLHCGAPNESILHVFWLCPKIKQFWSKLFLLLRQQFSLGVQYCGVLSFMERLWGMKVRMLLMFFVFLMDTSLSPRFLLLFHGSESKIWLFGVLLRHWIFG